MTTAEVLRTESVPLEYPELPVYLMTREEFEVRKMAAKWMALQAGGEPVVKPVPHGTAAGWRWFGCRCGQCTQAWKDRPLPHGTTTGYFARGCRCRPCRDAVNAYNRALRTKQR